MIYDFNCPKCGDIQINKPMITDTPKTCPICRVNTITMIFKAVPVVWNCKGNYGVNKH